MPVFLFKLVVIKLQNCLNFFKQLSIFLVAEACQSCEFSIHFMKTKTKCELT